MYETKPPQGPLTYEQNNHNLDKETLMKILDNSYDEIFVTDKNGVAIYINSACIKNYGVKQSDIIDLKAGELSLKGYCFPPITPMILRDKKRVTLEQKTITGRNLVTTATPVFDQNGDLELIIQNVRDITQIAQIKHDLKATQELAQKYKQEIDELRKKEIQISDFVARSKEMKELLDLANRVAPVDSNILIMGESGTGKGVMAKYIHKMSRRKNGPFITINCAAIPEQLLESELFGYVPGAFTGADRKGKIGLMELANGGTLFLDEIGEIPLKLQAKLLHVIQEFEFTRVGGVETRKLDCRIITATNRNLVDMAREGNFREDLFYRLNVIELEIPPLRERMEDIFPLIYFYVNKIDKKYKTSHQFSQDCLDRLILYPWPGNIRELEHVIERLVVTVSENMIESRHLPNVFHKNYNNQDDLTFSTIIPLDIAIEQVERKLITKAYRQLRSSYKVAKVLNISQSKASRLVRKYFSEEE